MNKKILTFLSSALFLFSDKSFSVDLCADSLVSFTQNSIQMHYNEGGVYNYNYV